MKPEKMATFKDPTVIEVGSNTDIANTPLGGAAIEVARQKIGTDDHAYFTFEGASWLVRQLRPHSFCIEPSPAPLASNEVPKIRGKPMEKKRISFDSAVYLTVLTGFFYSAGAVYESAYLSTLQLDPAMFDLNIYQTLLNGFIYLAQVFIYPVGFTLGVWLIWAWIGLSPFNKWLAEHSSIPKIFDDLILNLHGGREPSEREHQTKTAATTWFLRLLGIFLVFLILQAVGDIGKKAALRLIQKIEAKSCPQRGMIDVKIEGESMSLLHLQCDSRNCAGIDLATKTIYYFPATGYTTKFTPLVPKTKE